MRDRRKKPLVRYKRHDPRHAPYHPNFEWYHYWQDKKHPIDAATLNKHHPQEYPMGKDMKFQPSQEQVGEAWQDLTSES